MSANSSSPTVGFIGAGRVATALAANLTETGYSVVAVASGTAASAERLANRTAGCAPVADGQTVAELAQLIFITTPDTAVKDVAKSIMWPPRRCAVHCSGALTREALAAASGAETGAFHPLFTFGPIGETAPSDDATLIPDGIGTDETFDSLDPIGAYRRALHGVTFGIEAEGPLMLMLTEMAERLGGAALPVPAEARALYHAAAVMSCGNLTALMDAAMALWRRAGLPPEQAEPALGRLASATLSNIRELGPGAALTGPVSRGDVETVRRHLDALEHHAPDLISLYTAMGDYSARLAASAGWLSDEDVLALRELQRGYKRLAHVRKEA